MNEEMEHGRCRGCITDGYDMSEYFCSISSEYCIKRKQHMKDNDFGFSLVSEKELKAHEELLKKKVEEQSKAVDVTTQELTDKLHGLRDMILPLLNNLSKDPDKTYILWPDRADKIKAFIKKINDYVDK